MWLPTARVRLVAGDRCARVMSGAVATAGTTGRPDRLLQLRGDVSGEGSSDGDDDRARRRALIGDRAQRAGRSLAQQRDRSGSGSIVPEVDQRRTP